MTRGILEIEDKEITVKELKEEAVAANVKRSRAKKCRVCGMSTYQKEGLCVLCKTGIREAAEALITD